VSLPCYWLGNMEGASSRDDLQAVFGSRKTEYGSDEPDFDGEDTWQNVDKAIPMFDKRFAQWVK
jgi:hypothetical protein